MDTRDEDKYVRRHELARFESEMEVMNAKLNATLEGMRADMAKFYAAAAERELKREKEAAAREHRYQQEMVKFQAEIAKFQTQMANFQTEMANFQTGMANFQTEMADHRTDMAKRETRLIWALVGGFALLGTVLGILIRLPVS